MPRTRNFSNRVNLSLRTNQKPQSDAQVGKLDQGINYISKISDVCIAILIEFTNFFHFTKLITRPYTSCNSKQDINEPK